MRIGGSPSSGKPAAGQPFPGPGNSPKTPCNYIDVGGSGTLKGVGGHKANHGTVCFYARALDLGEPGKGVDQFYLQVYSANGQTLLLISTNPGNPEIASLMVLRGGNLQLHISGCSPRANPATPPGQPYTTHKK